MRGCWHACGDLHSAAQASSVLWLEGEILRQPSAEGNVLLSSQADPVYIKDYESVLEKVIHCWCGGKFSNKRKIRFSPFQIVDFVKEEYFKSLM